MTAKNGAFGAGSQLPSSALAVLSQRLLGTIEVGPPVTAALVGLRAALITVIVEVRTKRALLQPA